MPTNNILPNKLVLQNTKGEKKLPDKQKLKEYYDPTQRKC